MLEIRFFGTLSIVIAKLVKSKRKTAETAEIVAKIEVHHQLWEWYCQRGTVKGKSNTVFASILRRNLEQILLHFSEA